MRQVILHYVSEFGNPMLDIFKTDPMYHYRIILPFLIQLSRKIQTSEKDRNTNLFEFREFFFCSLSIFAFHGLTLLCSVECVYLCKTIIAPFTRIIWKVHVSVRGGLFICHWIQQSRTRQLLIFGRNNTLIFHSMFCNAQCSNLITFSFPFSTQ